MKKVLKWAGVALAALVVVIAGAFGWAHMKANARNQMAVDVVGKEVPVPWPLSEAEIATLRDTLAKERAGAAGEGEPARDDEVAADPLAGVDLTAIAKERALVRGKHLIESRVGCVDCHKADFGGGIIFDNAPMGRWVAPNLTTGKGSVTKEYTASDWDRILRHGVRKNGTAATMPAIDFAYLSDREVSDLITYIRSQPPVDRENPPSTMGPIFKVLMATGGFPMSAELIDHDRERAALPPTAEVNAEFGKHLASVCVGCHGMQLSGGPIPGADPAWPPATNLTPHETGLKGWVEADFVKAIREGKRPDGSDLNPIMPWRALSNMTDTEVKAIFAYLTTLPPIAEGNH